MSLPLRSLLMQASLYQAARFEKNTHYSRQAQTSTLQEILKYSAPSVIGRALGLRLGMDVDAFRRQIPLHTYDGFSPFADRIAHGEKGITSNQHVLCLASSSGTTGKRKMIPITRKSHAVRQKARLAAAGYLVRALRNKALSHGRLMVTSSAAMMGETEGGVPFGYTSACSHSLNRSKYSARVVTPYPFDVMAIPNVRQRHIMSFLFAIRDPELRFISGSFPPFLLQIAGQLSEETPLLISMLRKGGVPDGIDLDGPTRKRLNRMLPADPNRADFLERILETKQTLKPLDIWPGLSALCTSSGVASDPYLPRIAKAFGPLPIFGGLYSSTEAIFGIHTDLDDGSATLAVNTGFFEFIPKCQWHASNPETVLAHEVVVGEEYRIVTTNFHGLMRYDIGDIVRITGWHNSAPRLTFLRRRGGQLSAVHEMTTEADIDQALSEVMSLRGITFRDAGVTLESGGTTQRYLWMLELEGDTPPINPDILASDLDNALGRSNIAYKNRREDYIPPPRVMLFSPGAIAQFLGRSTEPTTDDQLKPRRILYGTPDLITLIERGTSTSK
ncbi:hypothetical protein DS909_00940 [Phaeobacter gallaeciensis]|uniref:GH3 auxin-responsive promoter n=2 Tax=Roseobacteraceae TaxID=2854170 RepID=A0A366XC75_9RHOB|nr:hypothetical protein DS909_00940 [Phaeobacter gallaeciensis]